MVNQYQSQLLQIDFAEHLNTAHRVLKHSFKVIPELFAGREMCVMDYLYEELNDKAIEIRLDTATLTCLFDKNDVCDSSFLFLDDLNDVKHYVDYCNKTYVYDFLLCGWMIENYCLQIKSNKKDYFFVLLPVASN